MTRLSDITRLDRLGLSVWQATRPMSRALSVHGGKGATEAAAKLGALLEAVESDAAERFDGAGPVCAFYALPVGERARTIGDFAGGEGLTPDPRVACRWAAATKLASGRPLHVPFEAVSLDFTRGLPSPFDRASNGVATGATRDEAVATALHELIERDAVTELRVAGPVACAAATLRLDSVPFSWLGEWRERLARERIAIRFHRARSVTGSPVFACELHDRNKEGAPYRAILGQGCHPVPEVALFRAFAEAAQARATFIAGGRDDLTPSEYHWRGAAFAIGPPPPPGMAGVGWDEIAPGPVGVPALVEALARAGYPEVAAVELGRPEGLTVVRAFACGLGSLVRRRRRPG